MKYRHHLLESFLPIRMLARLYGSEGTRPASTEFPAAVMLIDVSRYTALVEQLARRGQEGLENVPKLLNLSYARCAERIADSGGEVLCFSGDSLLVYWPAEAKGLHAAVHSAVACANTICRSGNEDSRASSEISPALHIGIGAGRLWAAAIGGQPVWNVLARGEAIMQAAAAQAAARSWHYVISAEATQAITGNDAPMSLGRPQQEFRSPPPAEWLTGFLPLQLIDVLASPSPGPTAVRGMLAIDAEDDIHVEASLAALNEIRPVSALFARIVGLEDGDPLALSKHQMICVSLQELMRAREGPPGELFYDDKGLVFSAAFGIRGNFHRDDPRRAVDAARAINLAVEQLGLSSSIGIATGDALFGFVGSVRRRQVVTHGAAMNRAARLMVAGQRGILCDAPTERASRSAYSFEERGAIQLTGLGDMAAIFRPVQPQELASSAASLIGRRSEMDVLKRALDDARAGGKCLLIILGESGIGKSALVTAFADDLRKTETTVSIARAERDDRRTSLLPWRRVIASLLGVPSEIDRTFGLERLKEHVESDRSLTERLPLLGDVLGIEIPDNEHTRHLQGAHRGDATMRLLGDLLRHVASTPLVLILEDSQWLDSASWRLAEWVLATHSSLLMLVCVRSEEMPEELRNLQRRAEAVRMSASGIDTDDPARFCRILDLEELSDASIRELAARTLGAVPPQPELADRIAELACGNPLFAEEITLTLKTEGLIAIREGAWRSLRPLDELRYFEGIARVIRERIDRIETSLLDTLRAASIIGRSFTAELVEVLLKQKPCSEIRSALDALVAGHFVRKGHAETDYEFRHDQIRDVVYSSIRHEVRQELHGILADWLERSQAINTRADIAVLAQHFEAAGNTDKAVMYSEMAATKALQVGAFREVEAFLAICFSHESRQSLTTEQRLRAVRWRIQLAEAQYSRGDIHAQGQAVRRALTLAGDSMPRAPPLVATRLAGSALRLAFQQIFPPALWPKRTDKRKGWPQAMAKCHSQAATVDYFELRFLHGMRHLIEAVVQAERTDVSTELAVACSQLACGLGILGRRRACEYFVRKAEKAAVALADPAIHAHVCSLDALWRIGHCHWAMVDRRLQQSQELSLQAGDQLRWSNAQIIRFWSLFYRGDWGALEPTAHGLLSRAQNSGNVQQEIWALRCKSLCALHADRPREALEILRLIISAMRGSGDLSTQISSKGSLALALARTGFNEESLQVVDDTLRLLRDMRRPTAHATLVGISGLCEVLLRGREAGLAREYDQWREWEVQALGELRRYSRTFPVGRPQYGLWLGVAQWLEGRKERAFRTWNQALSNSQILCLRQDEAMILAEIRRRRDRI
jgi:class 3 adenylate cyclase